MQRFGLDLNRMCFDPLVKVSGNSDRVGLVVLAMASFDAGHVVGGLSIPALIPKLIVR